MRQACHPLPRPPSRLPTRQSRPAPLPSSPSGASSTTVCRPFWIVVSRRVEHRRLHGLLTRVSAIEDPPGGAAEGQPGGGGRRLLKRMPAILPHALTASLHPRVADGRLRNDCGGSCVRDVTIPLPRSPPRRPSAPHQGTSQGAFQICSDASAAVFSAMHGNSEHQSHIGPWKGQRMQIARSINSIFRVCSVNQ